MREGLLSAYVFTNGNRDLENIINPNFYENETWGAETTIQKTALNIANEISTSENPRALLSDYSEIISSAIDGTSMSLSGEIEISRAESIRDTIKDVLNGKETNWVKESNKPEEISDIDGINSFSEVEKIYFDEVYALQTAVESKLQEISQKNTLNNHSDELVTDIPETLKSETPFVEKNGWSIGQN